MKIYNPSTMPPIFLTFSKIGRSEKSENFRMCETNTFYWNVVDSELKSESK